MITITIPNGHHLIEQVGPIYNLTKDILEWFLHNHSIKYIFYSNIEYVGFITRYDIITPKAGLIIIRNGISVDFFNEKDAMLFKLTWL